MTMIVAGSDIGAALGIERRFDFDHAGAEPLHHVLDHVVAANAQVLARDLNRQVPIAEMPGEPHHLPGIDAAKLDQRLGRCDDLDQPAVIEHQRVTAAQGNGLRQIEQKLRPRVPVMASAAGAGRRTRAQRCRRRARQLPAALTEVARSIGISALRHWPA